MLLLRRLQWEPGSGGKVATGICFKEFAIIVSTKSNQIANFYRSYQGRLSRSHNGRDHNGNSWFCYADWYLRLSLEIRQKIPRVGTSRLCINRANGTYHFTSPQHQPWAVPSCFPSQALPATDKHNRYSRTWADLNIDTTTPMGNLFFKHNDQIVFLHQYGQRFRSYTQCKMCQINQWQIFLGH